MALRKALAYSKKRARPYTRRSNTQEKAFIKAVPASKIVKFSSGKVQDLNSGKLKFVLKLIADERVQIRDNALESCRMYLSNRLEKEIPGGYFFTVKVHPHHFLRENKTAAGAGADRLSSGMKHSFGIVIGRAAMVEPGQELFMIAVGSEKDSRIARWVLHSLKSKLPCTSRILMEKIA